MGSGASSQGMIRPDHSSLLIRFPNKKDIGEGDIPIFRVQELEALINADEAIREKKFFLVSITGVYRSGKSFLLNLMQTYLDYYQKNGSDKNWEKAKTKIEGGKWTQSTESVTHGIWIWNRGFLINDIVIVLIDCQGTGDSLMSTPTLDNLILYLGLQLANVQILNLKGVLQTNDLERIDMCQHFSDLHPENSLFNCSLLYLLRDYNGDKEYGRKDFLFTRIADNAESDVVKRFASGIEKSFQEIATFALPGPGFKVTDGSDGESLRVENVDMAFLQAAKKLFRYVFVELPGTQRSSLSNGKETLRNFKVLQQRTVRMGKLTILTSADALIESLIAKAYKQAMNFYNQEMETIGKIAVAEEDADVIEDMERILEETLKMFQSDKCVSKHADNPHTLEYLGLLNDKRNSIGDHQSYIEQLIASKKQNKEHERNLKTMTDALGDMRQKHIKQQRALEKDRKERKLNKQEFKEKIEKLERETEAKIKAEKDEFEARLKQQQEQQAIAMEEIERLKIVVREKEKLATEGRRKEQEIATKYGEQLKATLNQMNQNMIVQEQFEELKLKLDTWKNEELNAKHQEIAELNRQLASKSSQELVKSSETLDGYGIDWADALAKILGNGAAALSFKAAASIFKYFFLSK